LRRFLGFCALFALAAAGASAADPAAAPYTLQYGVEWRMVRAGLTRFTWTPGVSGNRADLHLESVGLVSKLYRVNDDYHAQLTHDLCASSVLFNTEEGNRKRETKLTFEPGKVLYSERDLLKNTVILTKELQTPPCVFEYLGALHHMRSLKLEPGQSTTVPLTDGKKIANVKVEAQEREQVKTPTGTYNAIRYEVFLFNGVILARNARFQIWLTDDERKLPVQLRARMQFLIGTITLRLETEEPPIQASTPKETRVSGSTSK